VDLVRHTHTHTHTHTHKGVSKTFWTESLTKYTLTTNKNSLRSGTKGYGGKTH